jgi:hypothetical protein
VTDHHRHHDDWDQDALFYGVPSPARRGDEPTRPAVPPAAPPDDQPTWSSVGPSGDLPTSSPAGRSGDLPAWQAGPQPAYFDPTTMALTGSAVPEQLQPVPVGKGYGRLPVIVAALAVLLIAGVIGGVALMRSSGGTDADGLVADPAPQVIPAETVPTDVTPTETVLTDLTPTGMFPTDVTPTGTATTDATPSGDPSIESTATTDPQEEALAQLEALREQDLGTVTFDGRLVAQIASKYPGISDPYQTAADGSHTFQNSDILAEHQRLRTEHADSGHAVILLKSTDYGKRQLIGGQALWVTFVVGDFPDKAAVRAWCSSHFGQLSATELKNHCDARNLRPAA